MNNMLPSAALTTNLPFKWTIMSSDKHELSRQQGVVTHPRPLVQSAQLLPARLRTAEWRMEGWRSCVSGGGGELESVTGCKMSRRRVKSGDGERKSLENRHKTGEEKMVRERERLRRLFSCWFWTFDPTGPQVRNKQAESLGKHMDSIYSLHMRAVHRCR